MAADDIEPTIILNPSNLSSGDRNESLDVSRPDVGFVAGNRPRFADETADLLRSRLKAASLALVIILAFAFIGGLVNGITTLWWLRLLVLSVLGACLVTLRSARLPSLSQLRIVELIVFGLVVLQVALMLVTRMGQLAVQNDAVSVVAVRYLFQGAWCLLILIYGIFMPNTWKRGAAVMLPVAMVPYLVVGLQCWWSPAIADLLAQDNTNSPMPLPIAAALVGIYGTHVINAARREAFKARQFGQYRLLEKLGSGGMGEVYKAEHVLLKRPCAMKLIKPSKETNAAALKQFEKEVKTTAQLTHWNTIEIYDYGHTEDGTFYYVMELLPGLSLDELVGQFGPLPPERVVHLLRQVCGALQEAHAAGLIHRDIKPANIFAAQRGGVFDVAKLLDFGLVKERTAPSADNAPATGSGSFSGTPLFMPPEQASAYDEVDGRADIYALGAVAYFLLTGDPPFKGTNVAQLLVDHASTPVVPPSTCNHQIPEDLDRVVLRCLAKKPEDRFQDAASLEQALAQCQSADKWTAELAARWWDTEQQRSKRGSN